MISSSVIIYSIVVVVLILVEVLCVDLNIKKPTATNLWPALPSQNTPLSPVLNTNWRKQPVVNQNKSFRNATNDQFAGNRNTNSNTNGNSYGTNDEDEELRRFSEELLSKDVNNAVKYVKINLQSKTTSRSTEDQAPLPLMSIDKKAFQVPSIQKLSALYNNYILESNINEVYTAQEKNEENDFLDYILTTPIMQLCRKFLIAKGKVGQDPREFKNILKEIWFNMYARGGGRIGSSGFEHVFLTEIKNNQVSGLHNWLYFNQEELRNEANYLGYMKMVDLADKGAILKLHFNFHGIDKPVGSMFIGTSPELEVALYTTCFLLRADKVCPLRLNGNQFIIRTYTYRYRGKNMIGSAFPDI